MTEPAPAFHHGAVVAAGGTAAPRTSGGNFTDVPTAQRAHPEGQGHVRRFPQCSASIVVHTGTRIPVYFLQPFVNTLQVKLVFARKSSYLFPILIFS